MTDADTTAQHQPKNKHLYKEFQAFLEDSFKDQDVGESFDHCSEGCVRTRGRPSGSLPFP